jgi:O-methyltransferase
MWRTRLGSRSWLDDATYYAGGLATWGKAAEFLQSDRFWRAYHRGELSGHHLNGKYRLHIEWRVHIAICMATHASKLEGDFAEFGVNTGIISLAICDYLDFGRIDKKFYLFDTFCGIPVNQISDEELTLGRGEENKNLYSECFQIAKNNFAEFPNAVLVKGRVPESIAQVEWGKIAYLHLDMNIAEPERAAIEFCWDKLSPGAPVLLDDYGWAGYLPQRRSLNEFAESKGCMICELPTGQGLLIKPPEKA